MWLFNVNCVLFNYLQFNERNLMTVSGNGQQYTKQCANEFTRHCYSKGVKSKILILKSKSEKKVWKYRKS